MRMGEGDRVRREAGREWDWGDGSRGKGTEERGRV
jgi:hypothetical protein